MPGISDDLESLWRDVPDEAHNLAESAFPFKQACDMRLTAADRQQLVDVWYHVPRRQLVLYWLEDVPEAQVKQAERRLANLAEVRSYRDRAGHPEPNEADWARLYTTHWPSLPYRIKSGYSQLLRRVGEALQILPGGLNEYTPWLRNPLGSMLAGGLMGAGLGYAGASLMSQFSPEDWDSDRPRRNWTVIGALIGATPGALWGLHNLREGRSLLSNWPFQSSSLDRLQSNYPERIKRSDLSTGLSMPTIDSRDIVRSMWEDPFVASRMPLPLRAAGTGLLMGASQLAGQRQFGPDTSARWISPHDIARMTLGMGTGYLSGLTVGRGLQLLTGIPDETIDKLKQTGMWAGALSNLIPVAFGGRL